MREKNIYEKIAEKYNTTPEEVRTCIAYRYGDKDYR